MSAPLNRAAQPNNPLGPKVDGVLIPARAVVWTEGRAWVYIHQDHEHFSRREISTAIPAQEGWLMDNGFLQGERVVVIGAQLLLSEEFRSYSADSGEVEE